MFLVEISAKNVKFGYLNSVLGTLGATYDLAWWLVGKPMVDFLFALIELFAICDDSGVMRRKCTARLFSQGGRPLCTQIYLDRVVLHQPFLALEN